MDALFNHPAWKSATETVGPVEAGIVACLTALLLIVMAAASGGVRGTAERVETSILWAMHWFFGAVAWTALILLWALIPFVPLWVGAVLVIGERKWSDEERTALQYGTYAFSVIISSFTYFFMPRLFSIFGSACSQGARQFSKG